MITKKWVKCSSIWISYQYLVLKIKTRYRSCSDVNMEDLCWKKFNRNDYFIIFHPVVQKELNTILHETVILIPYEIYRMTLYVSLFFVECFAPNWIKFPVTHSTNNDGLCRCTSYWHNNMRPKIFRKNLMSNLDTRALMFFY